jgi:aspartate 1-decarboxylase
MLRTFLKAKLHRAVVTEANVDYEGSLTVDRDLMDAVGLLPDEMVHCANLDNGHRFTTYVIEGERGSRVICVNGAAAHLAEPGHRLIVMSFCQLDESEIESHRSRVAVLDRENRIVRSK